MRDDGKQPDGMTLFPWSKGKCVVWDYTCHDTLAPSYIGRSFKEAGCEATKAEIDKLNKYKGISTTFTVIPVAMETIGSWGKSGLKFVKDIGQRIQDANDEKRSTSFLFQSISIAVQRGNAASIRGTTPDGGSLDEIFYL